MATTTTPVATLSPFTSMNPTSTEHDFRFPRRPDDAAERMHPDHGSSFMSHAGTGAFNTMRDTSIDLDLDFPVGAHPSTAQEQLLQQSSAFPLFDDSAMDPDAQRPDDGAKEDPLATQMWKFFRKTKQNLPNQERMENLSWRMMALDLRKQKQQEEAARYAQLLGAPVLHVIIVPVSFPFFALSAWFGVASAGRPR